jgi:predicted kinase
VSGLRAGHGDLQFDVLKQTSMAPLILQLPRKTLIMPIGPPGCGKTTLLSRFNTEWPGFLHGADDVRRTMFGDVFIVGNPSIVHSAARGMLECRLSEGLPAAYDSTSVMIKTRFPLLVLAAEYEYHKVALVSAVPIEIVKARNLERTQPVPEYVIDRMVGQYEAPHNDEGFDEVVYFDISTDPFDVRLSFED